MAARPRSRASCSWLTRSRAGCWLERPVEPISAPTLTAPVSFAQPAAIDGGAPAGRVTEPSGKQSGGHGHCAGERSDGQDYHAGGQGRAGESGWRRGGGRRNDLGRRCNSVLGHRGHLRLWRRFITAYALRGGAAVLPNRRHIVGWSALGCGHRVLLHSAVRDRPCPQRGRLLRPGGCLLAQCQEAQALK